MNRSSVRAKIAALAGMVGPLLFIAVFTVEGWLRPGYDARRMFISALSLGPRGWIQIVNFLVLGVLFFVFSRGAAAALREGKASRAGHVLLTLLAVAFFASGPFVMDPMGTVREQMTVHGTLHGIFGAFVFSIFAYREWQLRIWALRIPRNEIDTIADQLIEKHGPDAEQHAFIEEDAAWRRSNTVAQGKWRRVRRELERRRTLD